MPIKFKDLCEELDVQPGTLNKWRNDRLKEGVEWYRDDKNCWFSEEGADKMRLCKMVPLAIPVKLKGRVLRAAPNPRWVYAKLEGIDGATPVAIPRKLYGRLIGKSILVDCIKDAQGGTTYRHEDLGA